MGQITAHSNPYSSFSLSFFPLCVRRGFDVKLLLSAAQYSIFNLEKKATKLITMTIHYYSTLFVYFYLIYLIYLFYGFITSVQHCSAKVSEIEEFSPGVV